MDIQRLISMANQIGDFYESYPDKKHAEEEIGGHINKFWALPMRTQISQYVNVQGGTGLHTAVQNAVKGHVKI